MNAANEIPPPIEVVLIKEEIADNNYELQDEHVLEGEEAMDKNDELSTLEKPENINDNMQYNLNEEHHIENFLNRVKKETELNIVPEEIQIKDECLTEATYSDSENKSNNKLLNEGTNKPDGNQTFSEDSKNREMDQNVNRVHIKRYKCDKCHKAFPFPSHLKRHSRIHTYTIHKCSVCHKAFTDSDKLTEHMRTHTGKKSNQCQVCQHKCAQASDLKRHMRIHTGEKPFKCELCQHKCAQASDFKRHMRIHTGEKPFQCQVCQYKCTQSASLKAHMRIHTGEKPFQCQVCQYKSAVPGDLNRHMRIHTGEKPFTCKHCQKAFNCGLKRHMRTHHADQI